MIAAHGAVRAGKNGFFEIEFVRVQRMLTKYFDCNLFLTTLRFSSLINRSSLHLFYS